MQYVLIDDNTIDNFIHRKMLDLQGMAAQVLEFTSGEQALGFFRETADGVTEEYLILLDLKMPGIDGLQFLDEFQKLGKHVARSRVVVLTSSITAEDQRNSESFPFVIAYENKPLSPAFLQRIHAQ